MSKLVVFNLGRGDLKRGFPSVTVQLWEEGNPIAMQFIGSLPPAPELWQVYQRWQLLYQLLYEALYPSLGWRKRINKQDEEIDIEIDEDDVTNVSSIDFGNLCDDLSKKINTWLKSESFRNIDQKLRTTLDPNDEIRIILATEDEQVKRLPWHLWDFFEDYQSSSFGISAPEIQQVKPLRTRPNNPIRILAIIGNSEGIDVQKDRAILENLPGAETVFLVEPQRQELDRWLWDKQGWDILFFAGHGSTENSQPQTGNEATGRIQINKTDCLTIHQLKNALRAAIASGLRLAIFNSCDGLGLVRPLASLHIPQMIVMREPVPDLVAQEFLKHFLQAFASGESFYTAVREAQVRLQGLEGDFPCASWLPVMCQNPLEAPLVWQKPSSAPKSKLLSTRRILPKVFQVSLAVTALVMGMRSLLILQSSELLSFDQLMRSRPPEAPDERILVVSVTEADVRAQSALDRGGASLSDRTLAQVVQKLATYQPAAIGLDIYRENPVAAEYADLGKTMLHSDRFIAVCKGSEEDKNSGVPAPPEVPTQRLGFSDVLSDPDGIIRRHLLAMAPAPPCMTDKSLSLRLATLYLAHRGIQVKLTPEKNFEIGDVVWKNLEENSGGYYGIDNLGHQVMLNWRSTPSVAPQVTLHQVLNNQVAENLVRDRIVIIGTTAESFHDYWSTPYSAKMWPHQAMSGVVIQAHMVSQILSAVLDKRPLLWVLPKWCEAVWVWCWSVGGGIIAWHFRSRLRFGIAIAFSLIILYTFCLYVLVQGGWIPLLPSALVFIACSAMVAIYTRSNAVRERRRGGEGGIINN